MKKCIFFGIALLCFVITTQAQDKGVRLDFDNYDANIQILKDYVVAMKAGDAPKLNSYFNDDAIIVGLGSASDTISKQQHLERYQTSFKENTFNATQEIYLAVKTNENAPVTPGEYAFGWGNVSIINKETKKSATTSYHVVALINNGKISFLGHYYDTLPFLLQQGFTVVPPKK